MEVVTTSTESGAATARIRSSEVGEVFVGEEEYGGAGSGEGDSEDFRVVCEGKGAGEEGAGLHAEGLVERILHR